MNGKMMFGHGSIANESILKLVDQLHHGDKAASNTNQRMDVVQHRRHFVSLSNRRLAVMIMYQSLHRDRVVKVWCKHHNE